MAIKANISMDFVEALSKAAGKTVIFVVVDRFSKYTNFLPLCRLYTAALMALAFFSHVFCLHRLLRRVTDRDLVFRSAFLFKLFILSWIALAYCTTIHL